MWVQEIWRYPVKSMAGESLKTADLTESGVVGRPHRASAECRRTSHDRANEALASSPSARR